MKFSQWVLCMSTATHICTVNLRFTQFVHFDFTEYGQTFGDAIYMATPPYVCFTGFLMWIHFSATLINVHLL